MIQQIEHYLTVIVGFFSAGAGVALIFMLLKNWVTLDRERRLKRESEIRAERADLIPLIKDAIRECGHSDQPQIAWRHKHSLKIGQFAPRFSTFLNGKRQAVFDAAWDKCCQTQDSELQNKSQGSFLPGQEAELKDAQERIVSRLQAVLGCVERA